MHSKPLAIAFPLLEQQQHWEIPSWRTTRGCWKQHFRPIETGLRLLLGWLSRWLPLVVLTCKLNFLATSFAKVVRTPVWFRPACALASLTIPVTIGSPIVHHGAERRKTQLRALRDKATRPATNSRGYAAVIL